MDIAKQWTIISLVISNGLLLSEFTWAENFEVTGNLEVKNNTELQGALEVKSNTEIQGAFVVQDTSNLNGSLNVTGAANLSNDLSVSGSTNLSNDLIVSGTAAINDDFTLDSNGTVSGGSQLTVNDSQVNVQSGGGTTTVKGGTQSGILYLNDGDATNTAGPDGSALTISGSSGGTAATVFQATTDPSTTKVTTRIGTSDTLYSQSQVYTQAGDQKILIDSISGINATAHNGQMQILLNQVQLTSAGMGLNSYATSRNLTSNSSTATLQQLVYGNTYTRNTLQGLSINNQMSGNTSVDGNFYVNGNVIVASSSSSQVKVINNSGSAGLDTTGAGSIGLTRDNNGGLVSATRTSNSTSLSVKGASGYSGLLIEADSISLSSGDNSATMHLSSKGLTLSNSSTGGPVPMHGVAAGVNEYDAVNVSQLRDVSAGIAASSAAANIPQPINTDQFIGIGIGNFGNETAIAIGVRTYNKANKVSSSATLTYDSRDNMSVGIGFGLGF